LTFETDPVWGRPFPAAPPPGSREGNAAGGKHALLELVMATHAGMTTDEFAQTVEDWLSAAKHPRFNRPYTEIVYQPMLELLVYLRANGFKTFIVSGGGIEFMRPWTEKIYGIPPEQVIGSSIETNRHQQVHRPPAGHGFRQLGRRFSDVGVDDIRPRGAFGLIVRHIDAVREYAYDRESSIGRLDKALEEAKAKDWTVVDMKKDWRQVFPFEK
jgi:hypothetical protein